MLSDGAEQVLFPALYTRYETGKGSMYQDWAFDDLLRQGLLLAAASGLTALLAVSPEARAGLIQWIKTVHALILEIPVDFK